jgi:ribosomal protein S12 methylthiotransferase accessory factor
LEWENNSIGNQIRPFLVRLNELNEQECQTLLDELHTMNVSEERPLWEILGLAIPVGTAWKQLRIGELKTLLALAVSDEEQILEGCDWIHHFNDLSADRRNVYRCVENILKLGEGNNSCKHYLRSLKLLYGEESVRQANALLNRTERFFGLMSLGDDYQGSAMHQTLLAAYDKLFAGQT